MSVIFKIRPYRKTELAKLYFPDTSRTATAVRHLHRWMERNTELMERLQAVRYTNRCKILTPLQVRLIVEYLGEP